MSYEKSKILARVFNICDCLFRIAQKMILTLSTQLDGDPTVTPVGIPVGPAVTASIAAGGGSLSSSDGMVQLTVPAGAVSAATTFSIQPILNFCPGGQAMAYRLSPDGIAFTKPVSLTFSYSDSLVVDEKFVALAYQGGDNTWFARRKFF